MTRPAFVSQSPVPWMLGVPCHHSQVVATAPRPMTARIARGWARAGGWRDGRAGAASGMLRSLAIVAMSPLCSINLCEC